MPVGPVGPVGEAGTAPGSGPRGCGRTFSDLTGTAAAYIKKLDRWPGYGRCMSEGATLRASAARVGVHPSTAFRWRHRLLAAARVTDGTRLEGWIELGWERFVESRKGERGGLGRPARRRKHPWWSRFEGPRTTVVVACDRRGGVRTAVVPGWSGGRPTLEALGAVLADRIELDPRPQVTTTQGSLGVWARFARELGGRHHRAPGGRRGSVLADVGRTRRYGVRLRRWLVRFRGVSRRRLPNYLVWHRRLEAVGPARFTVDLLRWPLMLPGPP